MNFHAFSDELQKIAATAMGANILQNVAKAKPPPLPMQATGFGKALMAGAAKSPATSVAKTLQL